MKYLGIQLDERLSYGKHSEYLYEKSMKTINALTPLMKNKSGYSNKARQIMY